MLGTPSEPGSFRITGVAPARKATEKEDAEVLYPLPADLVVIASGNGEKIEVHRMIPEEEPEAMMSSQQLPLMMTLKTGRPSKAKRGYWLKATGLKTYLEGGIPQEDELVHSSVIWKSDPRLGIARSRTSGTAAEGKIYTTDTVAMRDGWGFLVEIGGAEASLIPSSGLLRLGGDGRGAEIMSWTDPVSEYPALEPGTPFTVYLQTPGLFPGGWLPPGVDPDTMRLEIDGLTARLATAAVPRHEVVSGWDIAAHRPKPAQRAVPAGSVYHFDQIEGDPARYPEHLWKLIETELGGAWDSVWKQRRAEGFSNVVLGRWPEGGA